MPYGLAFWVLLVFPVDGGGQLMAYPGSTSSRPVGYLIASARGGLPGNEHTRALEQQQQNGRRLAVGGPGVRSETQDDERVFPVFAQMCWREGHPAGCPSVDRRGAPHCWRCMMAWQYWAFLALILLAGFGSHPVRPHRCDRSRARSGAPGDVASRGVRARLGGPRSECATNYRLRVTAFG